MTVVVVVDTNALPRAQYSSSALKRLIDAAGDDADVVIPEVVIWEWAEHVYSAYLAAQEALKAVRVDPAILPRAPLPALKPRDELVSDICASLPAGSRIYSPPPGVWRDALRDQILLVGSGETKSGVKTGAADAVVLACVEAEAARADGVVVLVTGDARLRRNALETENVRCATGHGELLEQINSYAPAPEAASLKLEEQLPDYLNERLASGLQVLSSADYGVSVHFGPGHGGWPPSAVLSSIDIQRVDLVEVHDLKLHADGDDRRGLMELRVFGEVQGVILDYGDPASVNASRFEVDFSHDFVDVTMVVVWDRDWGISELYPTGAAVLVLVDPDVEEDQEDDVLQFRAHTGG